MKECPKCHTQYDDTLNFCLKDGVLLQEASEIGPQPQPKKNRGCLKKVIIGIVIACVGLGILYRHLMNAATYLRAEPGVITASKGGGECNVDIDYDGYVWIINHKPDWVNITEYDNDFDINVRPNMTGQNREGSITIQSGKLLTQVVIQQKGFATYMHVSESNLHFGEGVESENINIDTDGCQWKAQFPDWLSITENLNGGIRIKSQRNTDEYRTGIITIREDNVSASIYVSQAGLCNVCHGEGEFSCSACSGMGGFGYGMYYVPCMVCGGDGRVQCTTCRGSGKRK